jgi:hypothetical protein
MVQALLLTVYEAIPPHLRFQMAQTFKSHHSDALKNFQISAVVGLEHFSS